MTRSFSLLLVLCLLFGTAPAQSTPLSIGDKVPDVAIRHVLNAPFSEIQLSSFKSRPVVLEFFGSWCGSCLKALPHFDSLQNQFGNKVQFIAIGYEPEAKIRAFIKKNAYLQHTSMLVTAADTSLHHFFPHRTIPHIVCLDASGTVMAITDAGNITSQVIDNLLLGRPLNLPLKDEFHVKKSGIGTEEIQEHALVNTVFTKALPNRPLNSGTSIARDSSFIRYWWQNVPLPQLLQTASGIPYFNRIVATDSLGQQLSYSQWAVPAGAYCFDFMGPISLSRHYVMESLLQCINLSLPLHASMVKMKMPCYVLVRITKNDSLIASKAGKAIVNLLPKDNGPFLFINKPLSVFLSALNKGVSGSAPPPIFLDATGYTGKVDLQLQVANLQNMEALNKELLRYGLQFRTAVRELDILSVQLKHSSQAIFKP